MYAQPTEVSKVVSSIETRFTALLSRMSSPEIFLTVGPGFPTTCVRQSNVILHLNAHGYGITMPVPEALDDK